MCAPSGGDSAAFGRSCSSDADCACPAPTCLPAPLGYCSRMQCNEPENACPAEFTCFDITPFKEQYASILPNPDVTHVCVQ